MDNAVEERIDAPLQDHFIVGERENLYVCCWTHHLNLLLLLEDIEECFSRKLARHFLEIVLDPIPLPMISDANLTILCTAPHNIGDNIERVAFLTDFAELFIIGAMEPGIGANDIIVELFGLMRSLHIRAINCSEDYQVITALAFVQEIHQLQKTIEFMLYVEDPFHYHLPLFFIERIL